MNIAIIAYGSLIWDLDDLAPQVQGQWLRGRGPRLPVEFARISPKRKRALVLVVDDTAKAASPTSLIASKRARLEDAIADLARRERCAGERIGVATRAGGTMRSRSPAAIAAVGDWLSASPFDAALWTELDSNFAAETGTAFTPSAAERHLRGLDRESLAEAWRYIEFAPQETDTPFRRHIRAQAWWRALSFIAEGGSGFRATEPA